MPFTSKQKPMTPIKKITMKTNPNPAPEESPNMAHAIAVLEDIRDTLQNGTSQDAQFYDNADLKRRLNYSDSTLYRMRKANLLPYKKICGKIIYPKAFFNKAFKI